MKRNISCMIATLGVWGTVGIIFLFAVVMITTDEDVIISGLLLTHATLSTCAIWWFPKRFLPPETSLLDTPESDPQTDITLRPLNHPLHKRWLTGALLSLLTILIQIPLYWILTRSSLLTLELIPLILPFLAILVISSTYLLVYCFWHLRTRYAGRHALSWILMLVISGGLILYTLGTSLLIPIVYCILHVFRDANQRGLYATPPVLKIRDRAAPLPSSYATAKSVCFILGWFLVFSGILSTIVIYIANTRIWSAFRQALPTHLGNEISESLIATLDVASTVSGIMTLSSLLSVLGCGAGALLIQISQNLRWRMLEEEDLQKLRSQVEDSSRTP